MDAFSSTYFLEYKTSAIVHMLQEKITVLMQELETWNK